jgi:ABC-type polysaccharide/polyol phosphate export permease
MAARDRRVDHKMTLKTKIVIALAIIIHSMLSMYSFSVLLGIGYMHPDDTPQLLKVVMQIIFAITWFPLLHLISIFKQTLLDPFSAWLTLSLINSLISVTIGYRLFKRIV